LTVLTNVTLVSSNSALPEDGDYAEAYWNCFNPYSANVENMVSCQ